MLAELRDDNKELVAKMRATDALCEEHNDVATASSLKRDLVRLKRIQRF